MFLGCIVGIALIVYWLWHPGLPTTVQLVSPTHIKSTTSEKGTAPAKQTPAAAPAASASTTFCPRFTSGVARGAYDTPQVPDYAHGNVGTLQVFLAKRYGLDEKTFVDGIFGEKTETYLKRYQKEASLVQTGVLDSNSQQKMLDACVQGVKANGVAYAIKNFTLAVGAVTLPLSVHEALLETGSLAQGTAFRIELIAAGSAAQLRVTGPVIDGIQSQTFSLKLGVKKLTSNWPLGLTITVEKIDTSGATLSITGQPTD